jgi:nitrite reductase/ring-hydroxylating ferredoxin subunit/uncharacterized membrane protein
VACDVLQLPRMASPRNTAGHAVVKDWKWLDAVSGVFDAVMKFVYGLPGMGPVKKILHGTWPLRHPLHPAVTDVTIGAYTAGLALDLYYVFTNDASLWRATDFVFVVAWLSGLLSIVSGLTDWRETYGEEKRTGMLHGLIMVTATILFIASILMRANGGADARTLAMWLSGFGWLALFVGAFFGGELPYGYGTEVNRQAWTEQSTKWQRIDVAANGLEDRKPVVGKTKGGTEIFIAKVDGKIYAMGNKCTHAGGPLNEGKWVGNERCMIECPWHLSVFDVRTGAAEMGPATFPEPPFETRVTDAGLIEVRAR